jgi:2,3-diketo-5-methylthio-1-phosphopentane phosphatase
MTEPLTYVVFSDFDGTIAKYDVGDTMFSRFGDVNVCIASFESYRRGEISARECWAQGFRTLRQVTEESFTAFAMEQPIDSAFHPFVEYCSSKGIPVNVVSDGFDAYVDTIMEREGLGSLPRFVNTMVFHGDGTVSPQFPHTDAECLQCANCKRNRIVTGAGDNDVIVYIGDGVSDFCPARYADIVFAKDTLVAYCETQNITFHRFTTFSDVLQKFRLIVESTRPKKRRTAELARKDIFLME